MAQPRQVGWLTKTIQGTCTPGNHPQQRIPLARDSDKDDARVMSYRVRTGGYPSMLSEFALLQNLQS